MRSIGLRSSGGLPDCSAHARHQEGRATGSWGGVECGARGIRNLPQQRWLFAQGDKCGLWYRAQNKQTVLEIKLKNCVLAKRKTYFFALSSACFFGYSRWWAALLKPSPCTSKRLRCEKRPSALCIRVCEMSMNFNVEEMSG